jgi:hypothetical protein
MRYLFEQYRVGETLTLNTLPPVDLLSDFSILNEDTRLDNFIVSDNGDGTFHTFMIDFGHCRFRGDEESDYEWACERRDTDEHGKVGQLMSMYLRGHGFELEYEMTERWRDGRMCEVDDNLDPSLILIRATERAPRELLHMFRQYRMG